MSRDPRHGYPGNDTGALTNGIALQTDRIGHPAQYIIGTAPYSDGPVRSSRMRHESCPPERPTYYSTPRGDPPLYPRHMSANAASHPQYHHHRTHSDEISGIHSHHPLPPSFAHPSAHVGPSPFTHVHLNGADRSANGMERSAFRPYQEEPDGAMLSRQYNVSEAAAHEKEDPGPKNVELLTYRPLYQPDDLGARGIGREYEMTASQEQYSVDLDEKIKALYQARRGSESTARAPKTKGQAPPTKEDMKSVMNMTPEKSRKKSKSEAKKAARNSLYGTPGERQVVERVREESRKEKEALVKKKLDKRLGRAASAVELLGYRRVEDYAMAPAIPEDVEVKDSGQWGTQQAFSSPAVKGGGFHNPSYLKSSDTVSTASSFEFHSPFSPVRTSLGSLNRPSLSPTQELVEQMETESPTHSEVHGPPKTESVAQSDTIVEGVTPQGSGKQEKGRVVYRQNLDDTCLDDVTVFGKHFDPSQLTQDRMEGNFGDISMLGLNPEPLLPPKRKRGEEEKEVDKSPSGSVKSDQKGKKGRSRSESSTAIPVSKKDSKKKEKKEKKERESEKKKEKKALKSKDSSISERESFTSPQHLPGWDLQPPTNVSLPPYVTPSRHKMLRVSQSFREGPRNDTNDVFDPEAKGSMPNLHSLPRSSASSSLSPPHDLKEGTPDSSTSEEDKPTKRRSIGYSLGRKLSSSMRELFVAKEKKNPTKRTTWYFAESADFTQLNAALSEPQVTALTEQERKNILEETEVIPKMQTVAAEPEQPLPPDRPKDGNPLAHLFVPPADLLSKTDRMALLKDTEMAPSSGLEPYHERSVDGFQERSVDLPSSEQQASAAPDRSESEYETASETEEGHIKSAVNIITLPPSDDALREAGYYTGPKTASEEKEGGGTGAGIQSSLPTIVERSPPPSHGEGPSYMMPASEGDPIMKTLDTVITHSPKLEREGEGNKKVKKSVSKSPLSARAREKEKEKKEKEKGGKVKKEESKKEKKPVFSRFSKQRTAMRNSPSPRSSSPATSSLSSDSRPSSGRFSPSQRPLSYSDRRPQNKSAQDSAKKGASDKKGGATGSPRGGLSASPVPRGRVSPITRIPSPKAGGGAQLVRKVSPSSKSRLTAQNQSPDLNKRRVSTPVTPTRSPLSIPKRTPSDRIKSTGSPATGQGSPQLSQPKSSAITPTVSRQSSMTSTVTPSSMSSSSPRQRRSGVSLPESPVSPQKSFEVQLDVPASIGEESSGESRRETPDEVGKLLTSVGEKLAPLSASSDTSQVESQPESSQSSSHEEHKDPEVANEKRGKRPKSVISALRVIGGRKTGKDSSSAKGKKATPPTGLPPPGASPATKSKAGNKPAALGVTQTAKASPPGSKRWNISGASPTATPSAKASTPSLSPSTAAKKLTPGVSPGLPPLPPSSRKAKPEVVAGRSMSTIQPPSIRVTEARASMRKTSAAPTSSIPSTVSRSSKLTAGSHGSLVRSSIRVSGKLKKNNPMSPEHRKVSTLTRPKAGDRTSPAHSQKSLPRTTTAARASMRKVSASPTGGRTAAQLAAASRASIRRSSSGDALSNRTKAKQTQMGSLKKDKDRKQSLAVLNASMRRTNTLQRPQAGAAGGTLNRNVATRSMRVSSSRKVSAMGTMPRASFVSRAGAPGPSGSDLQSSLARKSFKRTSSVKDVFAAFDEISAEAKGQQLLTGSDHRRAVRPKLRQKASASHLKMLKDRKDVTSELSSPAAGETSGLDPNTYSTYMAKKNLAPSAIAGLAAKLDLSTVKLRKTGIADQMITDTAGGLARPASPNPAAGADYDTAHPVMLLQIKGRRQVHTRLVEPSIMSMNSGDVYICISGKSLFHWVGKSANVIEKARGSDVVMRIIHKKELGCQATTPVVIKEEVRDSVSSTKMEKFWELLGGKKGVKSSESVPNDDLYEKAVNMVATVMQLEGEGDKAHFTTVHENSNQLLKIALLDTKKILLLDFYSEVYVWVGRMSPPKLRKKALELAKKHFDNGCKPPVFTHHGAGGSTLVRSSGRYRARSTSVTARNSTINRSGRRMSRMKKEDHNPRPCWALFKRVHEGAEHILFREKFSDWPEQGRIIKMRGHSTAPLLPTGPAELEPADVDKMLKLAPFEGLRLEGDNVHRGQGNYKVSRSTFACNRVHPQKNTKWVIKDNDNVEVPESDHGLFYTQEAYVIRWAYRITVVKELEGLTPGRGPFARDRKYQKEMGKAKGREVGGASTGKIAKGNDSDTETESEAESDDECRKVLESGGRDKVAYFFWQGDHCTVNEKGASALMTVELDKERGPQIRVVQGKEPPAFLNLFGGGMVLMQGRSETNYLRSPATPVRLFFVRGQMRSEACLVEINPEHWPLATFFRSRGCYVVYDGHSNKIYLWKGCKITQTLRKVSHTAVRMLKHRLKAELIMVDEGQEPKDLCALIGDKTNYTSLLRVSKPLDFTPRLFELSSTTGQFLASELLYSARGNDVEAAPALQTDLYAATQPAIFLVDAYSEVYIWLGWWPQERRDWSIMRETNITTGSAHARWMRDKKLAMETAQLYAKACANRPQPPKAYLIHAGTEPDEFTNLFPFWKPSPKVQELNCKGRKPVPGKVEVEVELKKYTRTQFTLEELKRKPLPEGVDPSKLETYLTDKDFEIAFKITREKFKQFSSWRQTEIKKRIGLF